MRNALAACLTSAVAGLILAGCSAQDAPVANVAAPAPQGDAECVIPARIDQVPAEIPDPDKVNADFTPDSQLLSLAWQPQACASGAADTSDESACSGKLGWTLHGLWPNSADGKHPRYCRPSTPIAEATVRANFCMTPSARLQQHEWAAHGTCAWDSAEAYFDQARSLWNGLKRPDPRDLAGPGGTMTAGELRDAFAAANPGLPRKAVYIAVASDNWLRELRLCHSTDFRPQTCPDGKVGTPDRVTIRITP
jgi:ribonuclease T2